MKLSELITDLQRVLENDGDMNVSVFVEDGVYNLDPELEVQTMKFWNAEDKQEYKKQLKIS